MGKIINKILVLIILILFLSTYSCLKSQEINILKPRTIITIKSKPVLKKKKAKFFKKEKKKQEVKVKIEENLPQETAKEIIPEEPQVVEKRDLEVFVGESKILQFAGLIRSAIGNPLICDIVPISEKELLLNGKSQGITSLTVWETKNKRIEYNVIVSKGSRLTETKVIPLQNLWLKSYTYSISQGKSEITITPNANVSAELTNILLTVIEKDKFTINPEFNSIIVQGTKEEIEKIEKLLKQFDVPKTQIIFEAKILEVSENALKELGLSWGLENRKLQAAYNTTDAKISFDTTLTLPEKYLATLRAIEESGKAQILASPKIMSRYGETAKILVGERVPIIKVSYDQTGNRSETVEFAETGVSLSILPTRITDKGEITALITPGISTITGWKGDHPIMSVREAASEIQFKDGETIIIAGLLSSEEYDRWYKVPLLSEIPILGNLFKSKKKEMSKVELIIALTPHIVK